MNDTNHWRLAAYFFVVLNPFSQALFRCELMRSIARQEFSAIYGRASFLSWGVYALFASTGEVLFIEVFQLRIDAFRIFGGLMVFIISVRYFRSSSGSAQFFSSKTNQIATSISIPFMIGPVTTWISILIGRALPTLLDVLSIAVVCVAQMLVKKFDDSRESLLGPCFTILMRANALFIGSIGIEMILTGLEGARAIPGGRAS